MNKFVRTLLKIINSLLIFLFFTYFVIVTYNHLEDKKMKSINYSLTNEEYRLIKNGDIILRYGYGLVSDMIVNTLSEDIRVSHCAIVLKNDTTFSVIHSVSQTISDFDGVQIQDIRQFIHDSKENSVIVMRYKNNDNSTSNCNISERAVYYLNKRVPFDMSFNINDTTRFFCTELIWKVIKDVKNTDIFEDRYGLDELNFLKFVVFFNEELFDVVFSHH